MDYFVYSHQDRVSGWLVDFDAHIAGVVCQASSHLYPQSQPSDQIALFKEI